MTATCTFDVSSSLDGSIRELTYRPTLRVWRSST